jgi:hypothetical protein
MQIMLILQIFDSFCTEIARRFHASIGARISKSLPGATSFMNRLEAGTQSVAQDVMGTVLLNPDRVGLCRNSGGQITPSKVVKFSFAGCIA